ncbi:hypothetical protein [Herbaspirillum chlorophenolicum]|uniref:hypothetical protein n=1 Tax=Herbaspirillum chlorophenolicum TaxID=211589 RepID=UPI000A67E42C|nr:hypothetical protein [Herbaspirillum chlorophenolicum]
MPPNTFPGNSGIPPGLHPQDYQEHLVQPSQERQSHMRAAANMIGQQFGQLRYAFNMPQQVPLERLAHIMNQKLGNEKLGAARTSEVENSNNAIFAYVQQGMRELYSEAGGDLREMGQRMQNPAHGHPPSMQRRPVPPRPDAAHEYGFTAPRSSSRDAGAEALRAAVGFDFNKLSPEVQLNVMEQDKAISKRTAHNARANTQYKTPSQPWRRNNHVQEPDQHTDADERIDEDHPYQDSDVQSLESHPLYSPPRRNSVDEPGGVVEEDIYGVSDDESDDGGKRPQLPSRHTAVEAHDEAPNAADSRPALPPRRASETTMSMSQVMQPTESLSDFPPPPRRMLQATVTTPPGFRSDLPPRPMASARPEPPISNNGKERQLPPRQAQTPSSAPGATGVIKRKAAPQVQASAQSSPPPMIPAHVNDWVVNEASDKEAELLFLALASRLGRAV